jgi:hypothetical protein
MMLKHWALESALGNSAICASYSTVAQPSNQ